MVSDVDEFIKIIENLPLILKASPVVAVILVLAKIYQLRIQEKQQEGQLKLNEQKQAAEIQQTDTKLATDILQSDLASCRLEVLQKREMLEKCHKESRDQADALRKEYEARLDAQRKEYESELDKQRADYEKQVREYQINENILRNDITHIRQDATEKMHAKDLELQARNFEVAALRERFEPIKHENVRLRQLNQLLQEQLKQFPEVKEWLLKHGEELQEYPWPQRNELQGEGKRLELPQGETGKGEAEQ